MQEDRGFGLTAQLATKEFMVLRNRSLMCALIDTWTDAYWRWPLIERLPTATSGSSSCSSIGGNSGCSSSSNRCSSGST